jgi:hypothetical protein
MVVLMAARLTDEERRLRGLTPGELADEVGALKAEAADAEAKIAALKAEAVRRKLTEANGSLFRVTLSPPGEATRLDIKALRAAKGEKFLAPWLMPVVTDWVMRCTALPRAK